MKFVTFLRHGRSLADDEKRFEGRYDAPLTANGQQQAQQLASCWDGDRERRYDRIVCSTLQRASETARIIGERLGVQVDEDELWMERDAGKLSGLTFEEGNKKYPFPKFVGQYDRLFEGTGESSAIIYGRALQGIDKIVNLGLENVLVVAHGSILQFAIRAALGLPVPIGKTAVNFKFGDLSYLDASYDPRTGAWTVLELSHLT